MDIVNLLSRVQFAVSALFHFIFVDLTLGLGLIIALSETIFYVTKDEYWRKITKFWGVIFGLNFAIGAATGLPLEFQFGTNWAYYSHYVGDIFGSILAMEGLIAFFLESTLLGIFFFGWNRVSPGVHLICSWLLFLASNLSALFILIANGWMQYPAGSALSSQTMRMELTSFAEVFYSVVAQCKFLHTVGSGYVYASAVVLGISAYYLYKGRNTAFARKNILLASSFGLLSSFFVLVTGDEGGFIDAKHQPMKVAAIEAMWETEPAPADFVLLGWPDMDKQVTHYAVKIPNLLGIIATRSLTKEVPGIKNLVAEGEEKIKKGLSAVVALNAMHKLDPSSDDFSEHAKVFEANKDDYGHALLLKRYRNDIENATPAEISAAASDMVPNVPVLFWAFRIMVGLGFSFILYFAWVFFMALRRKCNVNTSKWALRLMMLIAPLPLVASECGWIVAEMGRQPWTIQGVLPTIVSGSKLAAGDVAFTLSAMILIYSVLLVLSFFFMWRHIVKGEV